MKNLTLRIFTLILMNYTTSVCANEIPCEKEVNAFFESIKSSGNFSTHTSLKKNREAYHTEIFNLSRSKINSERGFLRSFFDLNGKPFLADEMAKDDNERAQNFIEDPMYALKLAIDASTTTQKNPCFCRIYKSHLNQYKIGLNKINEVVNAKNKKLARRGYVKRSYLVKQLEGAEYMATNLEKRFDLEKSLSNNVIRAENSLNLNDSSSSLN